jgi:hypothetical protein
MQGTSKPQPPATQQTSRVAAIGPTNRHCCWHDGRAEAGRQARATVTYPTLAPHRLLPVASARFFTSALMPVRRGSPPLAAGSASSDTCGASGAGASGAACSAEPPCARARWPLSCAAPPGAAGGVGCRRAAPRRRQPRRAGQRAGRALVGSASGLRARTGGRGRLPGGVGAGAARKKRCASASPALGRRAGSNATSRASRSSASSLACANPNHQLHKPYPSARRVLGRKQGLGCSATGGGAASAHRRRSGRRSR